MLTPTLGLIRDSSIDVGSGDDFVSLNATTFQTQRRYDPAYGSENGSIDLGSGNDRLFINANASGQGDIRAFGALDSTIDAGSGDDVVSINASANSWWGGVAAMTLPPQKVSPTPTLISALETISFRLLHPPMAASLMPQQ